MITLRRARTGPALLMLLLVLAGLFTMHTLGHFSTPGGTMAHNATSTVPADAVAHSQAAEAVGSGSVGDVAVAYFATTLPHQPPMPMGSAVACVAVLCGLIVWAMAAILTRGLGTLAEPLRIAHRAVIDAVRGPPIVPIGLSIADLSVARN